jgi:hypothetical protein
VSTPDQVTDLYRELAIHRVQEAIDRLGRAPSDRLAAQTAEVLEEAAGALACITAVYVTPGGRLDERFHEQMLSDTLDGDGAGVRRDVGW